MSTTVCPFGAAGLDFELGSAPVREIAITVRTGSLETAELSRRAGPVEQDWSTLVNVEMCVIPALL